MDKHNLWYIIPLSMFIAILLWQMIVINPTDEQHWDLTFACLEELYNITI